MRVLLTADSLRLPLTVSLVQSKHISVLLSGNGSAECECGGGSVCHRCVC